MFVVFVSTCVTVNFTFLCFFEKAFRIFRAGLSDPALLGPIKLPVLL